MKKLLHKILFVLDKKDKVKLIFIFLMMIISAFLDLIGVSAILPLVSILTNNTKTIDLSDPTLNPIISFTGNLIGSNSVDRITLALLIALAVFFIFKTAYAFLNTYVMNKFTMSFSRRLTKKQMETYLAMPYEFHLNTNSSTLIRKCTYDVNAFVSSVNTLLTFVIKFFTMIAIIVYLFVTSWIVTLIVGGALVIFSFFIIVILKPHIRKIASSSQELNSQNYKYLSQAFNGIKESKISNSEKFFIDQYDGNIKFINALTLRNTMYRSIPGHSLELIGMFGLILSLGVVILTRDTTSTTNTNIIETFSVFAYAVIKLLPCVTEINSTFNNMAFYKVSIDSIYYDINETNNLKNLESLEDQNIDTLDFKDSITVNNVSFAYSSVPDKFVLNNVSCEIKKNSSVAFTGASGAGKTTMIDIILGLLNPTNGNVKVDGTNINDNMRGWRKNISYIPQTIYLTDDTIRRNIAFGLLDKDIDDNNIWNSLEKAQLKEFVEGLPNGLDTLIGERGVRLSGGQRQRIGIARAFYRNTNIIVFDEATSALDYETERNILNHVNKYSVDHTLIIITHRLNTIEGCDRIYKIENNGAELIKQN